MTKTTWKKGWFWLKDIKGKNPWWHGRGGRRTWHLEQELQTHLLKCKHKAYNKLGMVGSFEISKGTCTLWYTSFCKVTPPKSTPTVPTTGNQGFQYLRIWGKLSIQTTGKWVSVYTIILYITVSVFISLIGA